MKQSDSRAGRANDDLEIRYINSDDIEEMFNRRFKKSMTIETTARVIDDEPDRSVKLFNQMHHFVETGKVEG